MNIQNANDILFPDTEDGNTNAYTFERIAQLQPSVVTLYPVAILLIFPAIVLNESLAAVFTPLSVTAAAIRDLPSLTDVFSSSQASAY